MANKLYFLINSLEGGGAEAVLIRLKEYLKPTKIFLIQKEIKYSIEKNLITFLSNHTSKTSSVLKTLYIPLYALRFSKNIEENSIVLSFLERSNYVNILSSIFKKHIIVISVHNNVQIANKGLKRLNKFFIRMLYHRANLIIVVSKGVADSLIATGVPENKIKIIYNPIVIDEINEKINEKVDPIFESNDYIVSVGRLTYQKGHWYLLRIFKEIKNKFPNLKLLILGQGELKNYLVNLSNELSLNTYVFENDRINDKYDVYFLGFQDNPFKYMSKAKIYISTSLYEGFENTIIEAMACGIPVISSNCSSGPREILTDDTDYKKIKEPEFTKYGVLMPTFDGKMKNSSDVLTQEEKIWVEVITKILLQDLDKYHFDVIERSKDFDIRKISEEWVSIFQNM